MSNKKINRYSFGFAYCLYLIIMKKGFKAFIGKAFKSQTSMLLGDV